MSDHYTKLIACDECGKSFLCTDVGRWVYKMSSGKRIKYFCSWKCLRACEKKHSVREKGID